MSVQNFKPTKWSRLLLYSLKENLVAQNLANATYEGEITDQGDTVKIISPDAINVSEYDGSDITFQNITSTSQDLVIDQAHNIAYTVDDVDNMQANVDLLNAYLEEASFSLADQTDNYIMGLYTDADASNVIAKEALDSTNIYTKLVEAKKRLSKNNVPSRGRWAVLSPDEISLLETNDLITHSTQSGDESIRTGFAGMVSGFEIFESNNVVEANDGTDDVRHLPFGYTGAITFAEQIVKMESGRHEAKFADFVKGLHVYGAKVIRPTALGDLQAIV